MQVSACIRFFLALPSSFPNFLVSYVTSVFGLFLWLCLFSLTAISQDTITGAGITVSSAAYLSGLQQQAVQKKLADRRTWQLLLKYNKRFTGSLVSEADGMEFFNSPQGKTDAEAELLATLASFFVPLSAIETGKEHPQCNFPARFRWLNQQLGFDQTQLEIQKCDRLDRWLTTLDPVGVTLVFASYFMNNPASMFGHTLIRLDSKRAGKDGNLLNYGANYAANPDTENSFMYALKGLTGAFEGRFAIFPYYTKVQEYNNWESRDLWEYELRFTRDQLDMLVLHLWELGGTHFDYYYFQENCSYHILSLLEVANPDLHLRESFFFSVIPADTVKVVMAQENLVRKVVYRPAVLSQMNQKRLSMNIDEKEMLKGMIRTEMTPDSPAFNSLPVRSKVLLLNAYMDYLQYQSMQEKSDRDVKIPYPVLLARSRLPATSDEETDPVAHYFSSPPHEGHGTDRLLVGVGHNKQEPFMEFAYRPTYHDLMAKDKGYDRHSEIIFMDFRLRYYLESERVRLDQAKFLSITALNPYDAIFGKYSWRGEVAIDTLRDRQCGYCNSLKGNYGRGLSYRPDAFPSLLLFTFADIKTEIAPQLRQYFRLGGDVEVGAYYDVSQRLKIKLAGSYQMYFLGDTKRFFTTHFVTRYAASQNLDMRLELNRYDHNNEGVVSVNYFF